MQSVPEVQVIQTIGNKRYDDIDEATMDNEVQVIQTIGNKRYDDIDEATTDNEVYITLSQ